MGELLDASEQYLTEKLKRHVKLTDYLPPTTYYLLLTTHYSLLTTYHLPLTTYCVYRHVKLVVERSADPTISFVRGTFDRQAAASPSATTGGQLPDTSETRRDLNSLNSSLNTGGSKEGGVIIKLDQVSE